MKFSERTVELSDGSICTLRSLDPEADAQAAIDYRKTVCGETPFLLSYPDEITLTVEREVEWLKRSIESEDSLMIGAFFGGQLIGIADFGAVGRGSKIHHRCCIGIAIIRQFCGIGLGAAMLGILLEQAAAAGFEQAELEVFSTNERAIALYRSLGFVLTGTVPRGVKFRDGSYADIHTMAYKLR